MARTPQIMCASRTATFLGISRETLRAWTRKGCGPPRMRRGKRFWYSLEVVREWLALNGAEPKPLPRRVQALERKPDSAVGRQVNGVMYLREQLREEA